MIGGLVVVVAGIAPLLQSGELAAFGFVGGPPLLTCLGVVRMIRDPQKKASGSRVT